MIEEQYRSVGFVDGKLLFLTLQHAFGFVVDCRLHGLGVLGVEGFYHEDNALRATDLVKDFGKIRASSWEEFQKGSYEAVCRFFCSLDPHPDLIFNFTVCSKADWESLRRRES